MKQRPIEKEVEPEYSNEIIVNKNNNYKSIIYTVVGILGAITLDWIYYNWGIVAQC